MRPDRILTDVRVPHLRVFLARVPLAHAVVVAAVVAGALALASPGAAAGPRVLAVTLDNDINPVTQQYLQDQVRRGERDRYAAVVIELDTPGGLGSSMREIVKTLLAAKVPVIVYVAPAGSSADSAGAVIGQAADVLAMAPQTNIGSSTPITTSGEDFSKDLRRKIVNDAAAYIGELARRAWPQRRRGGGDGAGCGELRGATGVGAEHRRHRRAEPRRVLDRIDGTVTKPGKG